MDKKLVASLIAAAFVAGIVLTWIFFSLGGRISRFEVFGIQGELPTATPQPTDTQVPQSANPTAIPQPTDTQVPRSASPTDVTDCSKMIEGEHHNPVLGVDWKFEAIDEARIIHIWSNHWDTNLPEFKFLLPAGQSVSFKSGGGSVWIERPGCNGVAEVLFQRDTFREITLEQYQRYIEQGIIP